MLMIAEYIRLLETYNSLLRVILYEDESWN